MKKPLLVCALCMLCVSVFALPELPLAPESSSQESITNNTTPAASSMNFGIHFGVNLRNNLSMPDGFSKDYAACLTFGLRYFFGDDISWIRFGFGVFHYLIPDTDIGGADICRTFYATAQIYPFRSLGGNLYIKGNLGAKRPSLLVRYGAAMRDGLGDYEDKKQRRDFFGITAFYCAAGAGLDFLKNRLFLEVMYNYYASTRFGPFGIRVRPFTYDFLAINAGVRF